MVAQAPELEPRLTADQVFHAYAGRVYNLARRLLGNEADAEDVTQDVLLQVVRKLDTFRGESALPTWLHRVTVNAALAHRRRRASRHEAIAEESVDQYYDRVAESGPVRRWSVAPDAPILAAEQQQLIEQAIAALPDLYRDVYVLADVEGLANAEIGSMLHLGVPAVKSRLHRARLMMRDALAPHFEEATP